MQISSAQSIAEALGKIPSSLYVMTAAFEGHVRGVMVHYVQQVGHAPPMVMVSLRKGSHIVPLIHDSHGFALCQIAVDDRLSQRRFSPEIQAGDDVFDALNVLKFRTGSPVLRRAISFFDCELIRHLDVESDHDLYVGQILAGGVLREGEIFIEYDHAPRIQLPPTT